MRMLRKSLRQSAKEERGIALLAVLWGVVLLSVVALMLTNLVQVEVRTAIFEKEGAQAYAFACGAVEDAIFQIEYGDRTQQREGSSYQGWQPGQRELTVGFGNGRARVLIVNESGKLDLNFATEKELTRLFEARGVEPLRAQDLAAAVVHWRSPSNPDDQDAVALDDYYRSQPAALQPRHGLFGSVEEALRVRGMTRDLFFGTVVVTKDGRIMPTYGVGRDLTIYSRSSQVNVNYASEHALESVPGIEAPWARALIEERRHTPFQSMDEIARRLPVTVPDDALPYLTTNDGPVYSIVALGEVKGSQVRRVIRAIVQNQAAGPIRYRILAWYDDDSNGMGVE
jgi:general secretion pathway protein K